MPWTQLSTTDMRTRFVQDAQRDRFSHAELCRRYDVSRKTGYKWLERFRIEGEPGLADRSHRPRTCPHQTDPAIVRGLVTLRKRHPTWGAKKLLRVLGNRHPEWDLPARSTAHDLLKRAGLVPHKRRRTAHPHPGRVTTLAEAPNSLWTADFKGQFKTLDGRYCYPLTIVDRFSRALLACHGLTCTKEAGAKRVFESVFRTYGLPERIRTDNGVPFSTFSLARLSRLSVWWIRLGIAPELIEPGKPQQNGAHERMHRTLKAETTRPPARTRKAQQQRFDTFRRTFNEERPHEALDQQTPASRYTPSPRPFPERLPALEYPQHYVVKRVAASGGVRWRDRFLNITTVLINEPIGFEEIDDGIWAVYFANRELGRFDERTYRITDLEGHQYRKPHLSRHPAE